MHIRAYQPEDQAVLAQLCWAYRELLAARSRHVPGLVETYYAEPDYARLIEDLPRIHARPRGKILLAEQDSAVIGCAMYYPLEDVGVCEIKRIFVAPEGRGLGAAKALVRTAMIGAAQDGYARMVLDTMTELHEAIALYKRLGFAPGTPFYELDPRFAHVIRFFQIDLPSSRDATA